MISLLFAIADPFNKLPGDGAPDAAPLVSPVLRDFLVILIAVLLLVLVVLLWAIYFRKPKKIVTEPPQQVKQALARHPDYNPKKKRFRKRRQEEFSYRAPTLAEQGGLPPKKQQPTDPANE